MAQQSVSVAIAFHSGMGHTAAAASAFAEGVASIPGAAPELLQLTDDQVSGGRWHDEKIMGVLTAADAIVFGAPTYMGMVSWQFKAFADATAPMWMTSGWIDKIAGGFTASGFPSGDKVVTLHYLQTLATQLRMIWVGPAQMSSRLTGDGKDLDQWGYYNGVGVMGGQPGMPTNPGDLETARLYGARIAQIAKRMKG